jgi:hypothetical protein
MKKAANSGENEEFPENQRKSIATRSNEGYQERKQVRANVVTERIVLYIKKFVKAREPVLSSFGGLASRG